MPGQLAFSGYPKCVSSDRTVPAGARLVEKRLAWEEPVSIPDELHLTRPTVLVTARAGGPYRSRVNATADAIRLEWCESDLTPCVVAALVLVMALGLTVGFLASGTPLSISIGIGAVVVTLGLLYCLVRILNRTVLEVADRRLVVRETLLRRRRARSLPRSRIVHLFCTQWALVMQSGRQDGVNFAVFARLTDGSSVELVGDLATKQAALAIVHVVSQALGLEVAASGSS